MTGDEARDEGVEERAPARSREPAGTRAKAAVVLAAVFLLGGLAGVEVGRAWALRDFGRVIGGPPAEARAHFRLEALRRHLDLRDDQVDRVRVILEQASAEHEKLLGSCGPALDDLRRRTDARLREVLDEQQKRQLDALSAGRGHRMHGHGPWGGPPHGPPP